MIGGFFAAFAELFKDQFFLVFQFIFGSDIVLGLADGTDESDFDPIFFLGHMRNYT